MFLKELTELSGVSGFEKEVRNFIVEKLKEIGCDYKIDKIGNVIAHNKGKSCGKTIMVSAHMDEVGLLVSGFDGDGYLKIRSVGGVEPAVLYSKQVFVGENKVPGVIGTTMGNTPKGSDLRIDIGASNKEEAEGLVQVCDYVVFNNNYVEFGENMIKAKALDDRVGCDIILELLSQNIDLDFYAAFTVMEEVRFRGAYVAAYDVKPDIAYVLEGTISADMPNIDDYKKVTIIGEGPAITIADAESLSNIDDIKATVKIAEENGIKYQYKKGRVGGNDAAVIFRSNDGCRVVSISLPCRYIHSPVNVASKEDYDNMKKLVIAIMQNYSKEGVNHEF